MNHDKTFAADIYIEDGVIRYVGPSTDFVVPGGVRIIDAANRLVIPGGIDPHTHFQFPFMGTVSQDDFYRGTRAAVAGGTTTISKRRPPIQENPNGEHILLTNFFVFFKKMSLQSTL